MGLVLPDYFRQWAALQRRNHSQIDELDISPRFPKQEDAAFRLHRDVVTVGNANPASVGQMQSERMRLSGILPKQGCANHKFVVVLKRSPELPSLASELVALDKAQARRFKGSISPSDSHEHCAVLLITSEPHGERNDLITTTV